MAEATTIFLAISITLAMIGLALALIIIGSMISEVRPMIAKHWWIYLWYKYEEIKNDKLPNLKRRLKSKDDDECYHC